jgi:hypothetical protein
LPDNATTKQLVTIFIRYIGLNPKRLNEEFLPVAVASVKEAFPCAKEVEKRRWLPGWLPQVKKDSSVSR